MMIERCCKMGIEYAAENVAEMKAVGVVCSCGSVCDACRVAPLANWFLLSIRFGLLVG